MDKTSGIKSTGQIPKVKKTSTVQRSSAVDAVSVNRGEAAKRSEWVVMLKQMPDTRPDRVAAAMSSNPSDAELARAIASDS